MTLDELRQAMDTNTPVFIAHDNGKIVSGLIWEICPRTKDTARVTLKHLKYHPSDTEFTAALKFRDNDDVYPDEKSAQQDIRYKCYKGYMNSITSVNKLFLFTQSQDIINNPVAFQAALDKSKEFDMFLTHKTEPED